MIAKHTVTQEQEQDKAVLEERHYWQENVFRITGTRIDCYLHYLGYISHNYNDDKDY